MSKLRFRISMSLDGFVAGPGPWSRTNPWTGWWGETPPFHHPVFVLTHHEREPLVMKGGTTFTFVTDGIESALAAVPRRRARRRNAASHGANATRQRPGVTHLKFAR